MPLASTQQTTQIQVGEEPPPEYGKYALVAGAIILSIALIYEGTK